MAAAVFRSSPKDVRLVLALLVHTAAIAASAAFVASRGLPGAAFTAVTVGLAVCWCSNTVSHIHIHGPLFRSRMYNGLFSTWITLVTGVPQSLWRRRHFWHHAGEHRAFRFRLTPTFAGEVALLVLLGAALPFRICATIVAGFLFGMGLCSLQGRMEHRGGARGVSYYGWLYNVVCFNDGYHLEHHRYPQEHWSRLPSRRGGAEPSESDFPPLLRSFEALIPTALCALERWVLATRGLEQWLVGTHRRALAELIAALPRVPERVVIVGGGLFPRSFLALRGLLPDARFTIVDFSAPHLERARDYLASAGIDVGSVVFRGGSFEGRNLGRRDLVIVPLAYEGDRGALRALSGEAAVITHDWLWRRGPVSRTVSVLLLKRVNLSLG